MTTAPGGAASDASSRRLFLMQAVVVALLLTLFGRLWFLQVASNASLQSLSAASRDKHVVTAAARGIIIDDAGNRLVDNQAALVVTLSRTTLDTQKASVRKATLERLGGLLLTSPADLARQVESCTKDNPPPLCNQGSPYQPVNVATFPLSGPNQVTPERVRVIEEAVRENPLDYPGVVVQSKAVRTYPQQGAIAGTTLAAQTLGHLGAIDPEDLKPASGKVAAGPYLAETPLLTTNENGTVTPKQEDVGRGGLEQQYDAALRGLDGDTTLTVTSNGDVDGVARQAEALQGSDLVLNLDDDIQKASEQALQDAVAFTHAHGDQFGDASDGAAAVVMTTDGRIVALASTPSFDETAFVSSATYKALLADPQHPLNNRAVAGIYPPGSAFKPVTSSAILAAGLAGPSEGLSCPQSVKVGDRTVTNFEGENPGDGDIAHMLEVSCDTYFAGVAAEQWGLDGGYRQTAKEKAYTDHEYLSQMAKAYGFGRSVGVDLPEGSPGLVVDRAEQQKIHQQIRAAACAGASRRPNGSPLQQLDAENCTTGGLYREGDAAYFAIGQGANLEVTPLQMAKAYAAIANGGTLYDPTLGKALLRPDGSVLQTITPRAVGKVPVPAVDLAAITQGMFQVTHSPGGTGYEVFNKYPVSVCGKTGTAEVQSVDPNGNPLPPTDTSWFGSFGPCGGGQTPKYVVMVVVPKSNQGAYIAAPVSKEIYDAIFRVKGAVVGRPNGPASPALPCFRANGSIGGPNPNCPHPPAPPLQQQVTGPVPSPSSPAAAVLGLGLPTGDVPDRRRSAP